MGILRSILTPDVEEIAILKKALDAKTTGESVVREQRRALSKPVPVWASRIREDTPLTAQALGELSEALADRIGILERYPAGPRRDKALERHTEANELITRLRAELGHTTTDVSSEPVAISAV